MEHAEQPGRSPGSEPIAIVGMACRFPGAASLSDFWQLLEAGRNAVTEGVPGSGAGRIGMLFPDHSARSEACRFGAFVDDIDRFDAAFFRISPVEAQLLDPQQRMMLETSWEALEDAGMNPAGLKGSRTGVYTGISNDEYRMLVVDSSRPTEAAACLYALSGTNLNGTSGRVAFVLGLTGPAKAVDAACASSLVSVHDAVADLQQGKADLAIAGGVQAILNSRIYELRARSMMLSPDGQCKAFDASANGYVRGEGCGVVILKRLREAEADGDRIWGVIRGAAMNHGGTSTGLTVPNLPGLEQVIESALLQADAATADVDYLEAHGTGTAVGDPIEINAVAAVYGRGREADRPLLIGSVKTNIGHLESAAGIAGLIKTVLVMQRGVIPKHLHFQQPNPSLDWDRLPLKVTSSVTNWPRRNGRPRLAGVNSFGISGTNAHIVVEEYMAPHEVADGRHWVAGVPRAVAVSSPAITEQQPSSHPQQRCLQRKTRLLPLSGQSQPALRGLAKRYLPWLDDRVGALAAEDGSLEWLLADMTWTAGVGRCHCDQRAGLVFNDAGELRKQLGVLAETDREDTPRATNETTVAFAFTGQGSQWTGMGLDLYDTEPVVRAVLDRCNDVFREERGTSLLDVMFGNAGPESGLGDTAWEQPALYALECALTALWSGVGVHPAVVVGHSVGELAAAQAAGVFSLEDGMRFAVARGTLLSGTSPGAMAAIFASPEQVVAAVEALNKDSAGVGVSISANNGIHQVISGPATNVETIAKQFEADGVRVRRLKTTKAFHSALVEPALDALEASLDRVVIKPPVLAMVSNLTGRAVGNGQRLDGAYWRQHARQPVAFAQGARTLADLGVNLIVEIGPRSVLAPMAASAWPESKPAPMVLSSLHPPSDDTPADRCSFMEAVAAAYEAGLPIRFEGLFAGEARRRIALPSYPFQRERYWLETQQQRRPSAGHPLLGVQRESASGEVTFETDLFPSDPDWLSDHKVFGRVIAPGALYGAMVASMPLAGDNGSVVVEDMQLHSPLLFSTEPSGRKVQVVLGAPGEEPSRLVRIFSKGEDEEGWTLHTECRVPSLAGIGPTGQRANGPDAARRLDLARLKRELSPADAAALYRARAATGIDLGPSFRTLGNLWSQAGEALGEVALPPSPGRNRLDVHPLLLDGCFQVVAAARLHDEATDATTYLPFGWERLWLTTGRLPEQVVCHVRLSKPSGGSPVGTAEPAEVLGGELRIYSSDGVLLGGLDGYTIKRATPATLLAAVEGVSDLLYEVVWRDRPLAPTILSAAFLPDPATVAGGLRPLAAYLADAGVARADRAALLTDLERWSRSRALSTLEALGWQRSRGKTVDPESLRQQLDVITSHKRLFRRLLEMLAKSGVLKEEGSGFVITVGADDRLPNALPPDPEVFADHMAERYPHGLTEIGLFRRCGRALVDVLQGRMDPLTLLFSSGDPTPADLYLKAPIARAANRLLQDAVQTLVAGLPDGRRLRVLEVGAGTGSATASVLPVLPEGCFDYVYTDISAGFFAEAESRFGDRGGCIRYCPLDIEKDPVAQGFNAHGYDLLIASNVLHATRYLQETLGHCRKLLAPSGQLVALENLRGQGWMDLTFGQLDGWWRFADHYRPHHALASPDVWQRALGDAGFGSVAILGLDGTGPDETPDRGVIVARGPEQYAEAPGVWVLTADRSEVAAGLASSLAARNQMVLLVSHADQHGSSPQEWPETASPDVFRASVNMEQRESWHSLLTHLPGNVPFNGVVHLAALDGHGTRASTGDIAQDLRHAGASALALVQGLADSDLIPDKGVWFITRGAQVLERETGGQPAGAALWGFGKAVAREAVHLQPRMIDLDPAPMAPVPDLVDELLHPDPENHIAYRRGDRQVARLVRAGNGPERLNLPAEPDWVLVPDPGGVFDKPSVMPLPERPLEPLDVRVAVEAAGLNFWDVFRSLGFIEDGHLGREMCGHVVAVGDHVSTVAVGDHVVGLGFGAFAAEMVTHEELVAPAPPGIPVTGLATVPSAFVSAALSYEFSGLKAGDRVLIHAGAGGVGLAAIQLAQAAGATVFATASVPKQAYLRSLGVEHIFDSRQTRFGEEILAATDGAGVDVVLNSLTSEGFIDASLSCLARGGRFVELARRDILSDEDMAAVRPDVAYAILELDVLKKTDPARVGRVLRSVVRRIAAGELEPLVHSRWPLAEAGAALRFMRSARHVGKIVVTTQPLVTGRLRPDRTYLVTGGLGGIGLAVAGWLVEHGAGTIVLNGRRPPEPPTEEAIRMLGQRGATIRVERADVSDPVAVDAMLARLDRELPPLGGVIHSVGVLSDGALTNQSWERFETVLWPKILGAWHLHRATANRDLDLFVLFSSRVGVMGNPGQANHAAANAFLDQLAGHRRALGLPGQAIAWGAWSEIGEAAEQRERIERQRAALGGRWFTPQQGLRALDRLVRQDVTTAVVMAMDWSVFKAEVKDRPAFLDEVLDVQEQTVANADRSTTTDDLLSRLQGAPTSEREDLLLTFLQQQLQAVLRLPTLPPPTARFFDLGMDSLMAVELRNRLNRMFAGEYVASNTVMFDYADAVSLAHHLAEALGGVVTETDPGIPSEPRTPEPRVRERRSQPAHADDGIAIVGMACRFPGAPDLSAYWSQLAAGIDAVTEGRQDFHSWSTIVGSPLAESAAFRRGGFVADIDGFDARFFGIRPIEAQTMDPQQRLLLETSWHALEDAGMSPDSLKGSRTGIYAGLGGSEYRDLMSASGADVGYLGTAAAVAVGRVAFVLGLMGPAMPLEMTCASSLAAVHEAAAALHRGEVDLALVGGVNVVLSPAVTRFMVEVGMVSSRGRCSAFDASADGHVRGEGCGIVVLKRLSEAEADGNRIWAVVRGSAMNHNGMSGGLTVPNGPAQEQVIEEALARAGIAPADVDYLEAHATGSSLGDPIEVQAAAAVYGRNRPAEHPLLIGTVKTNIGHLEAAAGMAGLVKVVLAMHHRTIPKHLHFDEPNPHVDWDRLPIRVTSESTDWPIHGERPPCAGVSAFGMSGTNAHVVVEGYDAPENASVVTSQRSSPEGSLQPVAVSLPDVVSGLPLVSDGPGSRSMRILPLSAQSDVSLRQLAGRYLAWLDEQSEALASANGTEASNTTEGGLLADMAWTAGMGRSHLGHRAAVVFADLGSLQDGLRSVANGDKGTEPRTTTRVAFVCAGRGEQWIGMGAALYRSEPVVRTILNRCDEVFQDECGEPLLDPLFGQNGSAVDWPLIRKDSTWGRAALYALDCSLTALWSSVGIRPNVVVGSGAGALAAAHSAGVFSLDDGLRLSAGAGDPEAAIKGISTSSPSLALISSVTGRVVAPEQDFDMTYWLRQTREPVVLDGVAQTLAQRGIEVVVEVGPAGSDQSLGSAIRSAWPAIEDGTGQPHLLSILERPTGNAPASDRNGGFLDAVAGAYMAGLPVAFAGLFAGEKRRRIALPTYPFEHRRYWLEGTRQ